MYKGWPWEKYDEMFKSISFSDTLKFEKVTGRSTTAIVPSSDRQIAGRQNVQSLLGGKRLGKGFSGIETNGYGSYPIEPSGPLGSTGVPPPQEDYVLHSTRPFITQPRSTRLHQEVSPRSARLPKTPGAAGSDPAPD